MTMDKRECVPGRRVAWWAIPAEPWATYPVEGEVTGVGLARVRVRVRRATGEVVERWVDPRHLSPAEGESFAHAVATSPQLAPDDRDFWLRVCEAEGK
jgi:hypothetical protein